MLSSFNTVLWRSSLSVYTDLPQRVSRDGWTAMYPAVPFSGFQFFTMTKECRRCSWACFQVCVWAFICRCNWEMEQLDSTVCGKVSGRCQAALQSDCANFPSHHRPLRTLFFCVLHQSWIHLFLKVTPADGAVPVCHLLLKFVSYPMPPGWLSLPPSAGPLPHVLWSPSSNFPLFPPQSHLLWLPCSVLCRFILTKICPSSRYSRHSFRLQDTVENRTDKNPCCPGILVGQKDKKRNRWSRVMLDANEH